MNTFNITKREGEDAAWSEEQVLQGEDDDDEQVLEEKGERKVDDLGEKGDDSGSSKEKINSRKQRLMSYLEAGNYGRQHGECWSAFPQCPISFLDLLGSRYDTEDSFDDPTESWYNNIRSS